MFVVDLSTTLGGLLTSTNVIAVRNESTVDKSLHLDPRHCKFKTLINERHEHIHLPKRRHL